MNDKGRERIDALDALRGFALAGIVVAHMYEQFISAPRPTSVWLVEPDLADRIITGFVGLVVYGKFFSIFSILFGISFAIMVQHAAARGRPFTGRFLWRLAILFAFGFFHSLLYRGDILTVYVSVGILLPLLYHLPNKWLLITALVMFAGTGRYLFFYVTGSTTLLPEQPMPESTSVAEYVQLLKSASLLEVARENFLHGFAHKFDFQLGMMGRQYLTLGYFLIGIWLYRTGFARNPAAHRPLMKRICWLGLGLMVLFSGLMAGAFMLMPEPFNMASWHFMFALTLYDFASLAGTTFIACGFLLIYLKHGNGWLSGFTSYGRAALSNYLLQSVIGTFLFYGWGLGLLGELHDWQTMLLGVALISLQLRLSSWWLSRYQYGPFEWAWRAGTDFRIPRLKTTI